jgi:nitrous oxidase accessory protein NosD
LKILIITPIVNKIDILIRKNTITERSIGIYLNSTTNSIIFDLNYCVKFEVY